MNKIYFYLIYRKKNIFYYYITLMSEEAQGPEQSAPSAPSSRSMRAVMQVNKLDYKMLDNISVVRSRRLTQSSFGKSTYSNGEIATVYLNNSSAYIDPSRSFLRFKINFPTAKLNTATTVKLSNGSALNIFKSVTLTLLPVLKYIMKETSDNANILKTDTAMTHNILTMLAAAWVMVILMS